MGSVFAELLALVAPPGCASCRAPTGAGERLCARCTRALPWLRRACPRCALPSHRGRACPASGAAFARAWAPMAYEGVARDLIAALKFRGALGVADLMAAHMAANLPAELRRPAIAGGDGWRPATDGRSSPGGGDGWRPATGGRSSPGGGDGWRPAIDGRTSLGGEGLWRPATGGRSSPGGGDGWRPATLGDGEPGLAVVVPVPTVASRSRRRGFDPAGAVAAAFARRLGRPLVACLERRDHAARQVGTGRRARRAPGRIAFVARAPPPLVLLVDDVHTTGATLDAAARALVAHGVTVVAALSYARTL